MDKVPLVRAEQAITRTTVRIVHLQRESSRAADGRRTAIDRDSPRPIREPHCLPPCDNAACVGYAGHIPLVPRGAAPWR